MLWAVKEQRRSGLRNFRDLQVWQKAHQLALSVYRVTATFPREETYGLTGQIRRACVSIPANIAGGCGRGGTVEFARYLGIARGSASELEYELLLAHDLGYCADEDYRRIAAQVEEVERLLTAYRARLVTPDGP